MDRFHVRIIRKIALIMSFLMLLIGGGLIGMNLRWFRSERIAWALRHPEPAYNFGVVTPGRLYRCRKPDERFVRYVKQVYGIQHIISLSGSSGAEETSRKLGIDVTVFKWSGKNLPPLQELQAVLTIIDRGKPVLIHCAAGKDRTGYMIAVYRVQRQNWRLDQAIQEMVRYGHRPSTHPQLHRELSELLGDRRVFLGWSQQAASRNVAIPMDSIDFATTP